MMLSVAKVMLKTISLLTTPSVQLKKKWENDVIVDIKYTGCEGDTRLKELT
jgi:hypothetical protein